VQKLAEYLNCILQGMSISAREGATFEKLMQIARTTLRLWPELSKLNPFPQFPRCTNTPGS
jgi:hypothetical protein